MRLLKCLLSLVSFTSIVCATSAVHDTTFVPHLNIRISEQVIEQSCLPAKPTILINGTSPGPVLRLKTGRTYWIRVHNDMKDKNTTMHWHGLSMATSPFSDGTPAASQWPIPPSHFFDYELHVPTGMEGTYFYHCHVGFQAVSASAPLIISSPHKPPPFHFDEERIFHIQDLFRKNDSVIEKGLVSSPLVWSGESDMILVNGKGGGDANGTYCNASLSTIDVEPGKTYYIRLIGATALTFTSLVLEDHDFEVVEVDGFYVKNHRISHLQIGNGQRFGVLLHTKSKPKKKTYSFQLESRDRPTVTTSYAILSYAPNSKPDKNFNNNSIGNTTTTTTYYPPTTPPLTVPATDQNFLEYALQPRSKTQTKDFPTAEEVTRTVKIVAHQSVAGATTWLNSGYSWFESFPKEPYLVSLYKDNIDSFPNMTRALLNGGIDPVTRAFPARMGEVIEIIIQNTGADKGGLDSHPWHAHGAHYWDLGSGNGSYDAVANEKKIRESGNHPVKRDTTMLYRYAKTTTNNTEMGWRAWRIRVDTPGVWMVHCHVLQHMLMGMQSVWVMGDREEVLGKVGWPDVQGYLYFGGSVVGNETWWPRVNEFFEEGDAEEKVEIGEEVEDGAENRRV